MQARTLQGGVALAFVMVACGCQPSETVAADNQTDENPSCNCIEVQHDNPVLTEDVLLVEQPFAESAKRVDSAKWAYTSFDTEVNVTGAPLLYVIAAGNDALSPSSSTGQQLLHTWPTSDGQWTPGPDPVQMPWELHGARFGYFTSTVRVSKVRANSSTVLASNVTRFRVASNVLIVPIQAILILPEYPKPEYEAIMRATFGAEEQGVLWDDRWRAERQRFTRPGGILNQIQAQWTHRSTLQTGQTARRAGSTFLLPDDIFDVCGIQFRLVSFHELRVSKELFELYRPDGRAEVPICDKFPGIQNRMFQLDKKAVDLPGVRSDLPRVIFNWTVQPAVCNDIEPLVDVACDPEDSGCSEAGFVVVGLENLKTRKHLVLAHELGHILSLGHRSDASCAADDFLMCGKVGSLSPELQDKASECAEAREWALQYRDAYLDGGG